MTFDLFASLIITPGVRAPLQMTSGGNAKINTVLKMKKNPEWIVSKLVYVQKPRTERASEISGAERSETLAHGPPS